MPWITPDNLVLAPALIFTNVLMVAHAPGIPPNTAAIVLPIPCPISSLLLLCLVLVMVSATTDVNKESIEPKAANVIPDTRIKCRCWARMDHEKIPCI